MSKDLDIRRLIDALCNRFEEAWSTESPPAFEFWLSLFDPKLRDQLLEAPLKSDIE